MEHENLNNQESAQLGIGAVSGSLPSMEIEMQVLKDYLDWCKNKYMGLEIINDELIEQFVNGQ